MPRSFDIGATRSAAGSRRSVKETPACEAHRESRLAFTPARRLVAVLGTVVVEVRKFR
jgi:hypothetical protein